MPGLDDTLAPQGRADLQRLDVRRLLALRADLDVERDALVLLQRFEAVGADLRKVREQIFTACVRRDEAKPLSIVEPFDDTGFHVAVSLKILKKRAKPIRRKTKRYSVIAERVR